MLYPLGKDGRKRIGEDSVEIIENAFPWPKGWLDTDAPLPAQGIHEVRRANLQRWIKAHSVPPRERSYFSQLLGGSSFGERAARRLERDYDMGDGYLDRPLTGDGAGHPAAPGVAGVAAALDGARPVVDGIDGAGGRGSNTGAFLAGVRNGRGGDSMLALSGLPDDLQRICQAYTEGGVAKQEALRQLAELPDPEMATLLLVIQSIKARYTSSDPS